MGPPLADTKDANSRDRVILHSMNKDREKRILEERLERCRQFSRDFPDGLTAEHLRQIEAALVDDLRALDRHDFSALEQH